MTQLNHSRLLAAGLLAVLAAPVAAQTDSRLQIHGYLSQAAGIADGGTYLGVPEAGTLDYRTLAVQLRYGFSERENLTIQFSHRRLGESPVVTDEPDLKLDWAFWGVRRRGFDLRVGRMPIPAGIYNEVRDVGVVLPLFRAPYDFYFEGGFTSETVDGAVGRYHLLASKPWNAELSAYAGSWETLDREANFDVDPNTGAILSRSVSGTRVAMRRGFGTQLWLNTPREGTRVGFGTMRMRATDGQFPGLWTEWHASAEAVISRATVRAEYRKFDLPDLTYAGYYGSLTVQATERLALHGQAEFADLVYEPLSVDADYDRTTAIGASWRVRPNLVLKGEAHQTRGYWSDVPVRSVTPIGPNPADAPARVRYFLISLSTSF